MPGKYMSIRQLAKTNGVGKNAVYSWKSKGLLKPSCSTGKNFKYTQEAFEEAARLSLKENQNKEYKPNSKFSGDSNDLARMLKMA